MELGKFMYMSSQKTLPEVFQNYFLSLENVHEHYTSSKSNNNYFLPYVRSNNATQSCRLNFKELNFGLQFRQILRNIPFICLLESTKSI